MVQELFTIEDVVKANNEFMKMDPNKREQLPKLIISEQEINYAFGKAQEVRKY